MGGTDEGIDWQERKLIAEVGQIELRTAAEKERLQSERDKAAKESDKLDAEIRELNRPVWRRGGFWAAFFPVIGVIVSAVYAVSTDFFGNLNNLVEAQNERLKAEAKELEAETTLLQFQKEVFEQQKASIVAESERARAELESLEIELAEARVTGLVETMVSLSDSEVASWNPGIHGRLVERIKETPDQVEQIVSALEEEDNLLAKAQIEKVLYIALEDDVWWDRVKETTSTAISEGEIDHFWYLIRFHEEYPPPDPDVVADGCDYLSRSFIEYREVEVRRDISYPLSVCLDDSDGDGVKRKPDSALLAAARDVLVEDELTAFSTVNMAEIIGFQNPYAGLLLLTDEWRETDYVTEWWADEVDEFVYLFQSDLSIEAQPAEGADIAEWQAFLNGASADLKTIRQSPPSEWPTAPSN